MGLLRIGGVGVADKKHLIVQHRSVPCGGLTTDIGSNPGDNQTFPFETSQEALKVRRARNERAPATLLDLMIFRLDVKLGVEFDPCRPFDHGRQKIPHQAGIAAVFPFNMPDPNDRYSRLPARVSQPVDGWDDLTSGRYLAVRSR